MSAQVDRRASSRKACGRVEPRAILELLVGLAEEAGVAVRVVRAGEGEPPPRSGLCRVRGRPVLVLCSAEPLDARIEAVAAALRTHGAGVLEERFLRRPSASASSAPRRPPGFTLTAPFARRLGSGGRAEGNRRSRSPSRARKPRATSPPDRGSARPAQFARIRAGRSETGRKASSRGPSACPRSRGRAPERDPADRSPGRRSATRGPLGGGRRPHVHRDRRSPAASTGSPPARCAPARAREPFAMLTAYDFTFARLFDEAGHRRAAGGRLARQDGAGPRHDAARDARRDGLPLRAS